MEDPQANAIQDQPPTPEASRFLAALQMMQANAAKANQVAQSQMAPPALPPAAQQYLNQTQPSAAPVAVPQNPPPANVQPSEPGPIKRGLTSFLYGAGQAALQHVGLPTDYEKQQNASKLAIQQQQANDMSAYRQAQTSGLTAKASQLDDYNTDTVVPSDFPIKTLAGKTIPKGAYLGLLKTLPGFVSKEDATAAGLTKTGEIIQGRSDVAGKTIAGRQRAAETAAAARIESAHVMGGNRAIQVVDPNDPTKTIFVSPSDAKAGGMNGTQSADFQAARGVLKDFTAGSDAHTLNAINTARGHVDQGLKAADALGNGDINALNHIANIYKVQTGQSAPLVFNSVKTALTGEIAKAFTGAGATVSEVATISKEINDANSPQQLKDVLSSYGHLLDSKQGALKQQYDQGIGAHPNFNPAAPAPAAPSSFFQQFGGKAR